jgi:hypothetical protein
LFLTIEDDFFAFLWFSLFRAFMCRRTAGFLLRPIPVVERKSLRLKSKAMLLKFLRYFRNVRVITIVPFEIDNRFDQIADSGIYDIQLWDLRPEHVASVVRGRATLSRRGNPLICALGTQTVDKGFPGFVAVTVKAASTDSPCQFEVGGDCAQVACWLPDYFAAGGRGTTSRMEESELFDLYSRATFIWCCYDSRYDQASGVLGRAIQFGVPVIVRKDSLSHKLCIHLKAPHLAVHSDCEEDTIVSILAADVMDAKTDIPIEQLRAQSISILRNALQTRAF